MEKEIITIDDLWKEVGKLYHQLGNKLHEIDRLLKKKVN